jgi:two-component system nitrogen regulation response regulator GlnG
MAEVWIADDDESIRFVLGEALREAGSRVRAFADADDLLAAAEDGAPDVIVTDVRMPGTGGLK